MTKTRAFGSPRRYIQGPNEFNNIVNYASIMGERICFLVDSFLFDEIEDRISRLIRNSAMEHVSIKFNGECCEEEIGRITGITESKRSNVFVGVGGGKTMDTAKMCSDRLDIPLIIVPTTVSTDAPVSEIAVLYTTDGVYIGSQKMKRGAELVLLDSQIIIKAPVRLFIAGIGDALATWFESRACHSSDGPNYIGEGFVNSLAGMAISKACYDTILKDSYDAIEALSKGSVTEAFENIIEANTLLSGLGFCNTGLSIAHGIHSGLTVIPESHHCLHGEKVSFGLVCQLSIEDTDETEMDKILLFMLRLGLPVTLKQLDIDATDETIMRIAEYSCENALVYHEPFKVDKQKIFQAIVDADRTGTKYIEQFRQRGEARKSEAERFKVKKQLLGIDFGTGACKATVIESTGRVCAVAFKEYPSEHEFPKWSEQKPEYWFDALISTSGECKRRLGNDFSALKGIAVTASTHNAVLLDKNNDVIRNCIMWNDQRSDKQVARLKDQHGNRIFQIAMAIPSTTWTLPQLMWVKENEPQNYSKIARIMFIKDYIRHFLTGDFYTDIVDAQGSLLFDSAKNEWSKELCDLINLPLSLLPSVRLSREIAGYVGKEAARLTGLPEGVPVITGCSDTAAEDFGAGAVKNGQMVIKMATAGNVNIISNQRNPHPKTYTYPYSVDGMWYTVSGTSTCAASYRWLRDSLYSAKGNDVYELMNSEAKQSRLGAQGLIFHPYLLGERCPYFNSDAKANYFGISMFHTRADFTRALLEGVGYSLYDCFLVLQDFNKDIEGIKIIGGGSKNPFWSQIVCDIFGLEIQAPQNAESSFGGALLAGVGVGIFDSELAAVAQCVKTARVYKPDAGNHKKYMKYFGIYKEIVESFEPLWTKLSLILES